MPQVGLAHKSARKRCCLRGMQVNRQDQGPWSQYPLPAKGTDEHLVGGSSSFYQLFIPEWT